MEFCEDGWSGGGNQVVFCAGNETEGGEGGVGEVGEDESPWIGCRVCWVAAVMPLWWRLLFCL